MANRAVDHLNVMAAIAKPQPAPKAKPATHTVEFVGTWVSLDGIQDINVVAAIPSDVTLRKYGMSAGDYEQELLAQGFRCPICKRSPVRATDGLMHLVVDHFHARGYKKMSPEQKKKNVRGLVCITCNRYLVNRNVTIEKAEAAIEYLRDFQARIDAEAGVAL